MGAEGARGDPSHQQMLVALLRGNESIGERVGVRHREISPQKGTRRCLVLASFEVLNARLKIARGAPSGSWIGSLICLPPCGNNEAQTDKQGSRPDRAEAHLFPQSK